MIETKTSALAEARIRSGYTQRALARELGLSSGYLSQIENGDRNPSPPLAKRLHEKLKVPFEQLFTVRIDQSQNAAKEAL